MPIKVILFDLDGVLVDACEIHYRSLNKALSEASHYIIPRSQHENFFDGWSTRQKLDFLVRDRKIEHSDVHNVYVLKQRYTIEAARDYLKKDQVKIDMCRQFNAEGYLLGCVSNCVRQSVDLLLALVGVKHFMLYTVSNEDVENPKPNPDPYLNAIQWFVSSKLATHPDEFVAIEDNLKGVHSAQGAGIRCLQLDFPDVNLENIQEAIAELK